MAIANVKAKTATRTGGCRHVRTVVSRQALPWKTPREINVHGGGTVAQGFTPRSRPVFAVTALLRYWGLAPVRPWNTGVISRHTLRRLKMGGRSIGRVGCCHWLGKNIKNWTSRFPFNRIKNLVVVWQILTIFPTIAMVDFPPCYSRFLSWIDVVNLDLGHIMSSSCILPSVTFYERLLVTTLVPIVLAGVLVLTYQSATRTAGNGPAGVIACRAARSRHMAAGLLLLFLVSTRQYIVKRTVYDRKTKRCLIRYASCGTKVYA